MAERKGRGKFKAKREQPEFDQQIIDLSRVTRVTKGGKQLSFRACVVIGDRRGRVGYGLDKGKDVQMAVEKAVAQAKKHLIRVPIVNETIPHRVETKYKAGRIMMKPAPRGSGIIAGSSLRVLLELAGVPNASGKILSKTHNKVTNLKAAFETLTLFKPVKARAEKATTVVTEEENNSQRSPKPTAHGKMSETAKASEPPVVS